MSSHLSPSTKANFLFLCDVCLTNFEISLATDDSKRVKILENKVCSMAEQLAEITSLLKASLSGDKVVKKDVNVWADQERVEKVVKSKTPRNIIRVT